MHVSTQATPLSLLRPGAARIGSILIAMLFCVCISAASARTTQEICRSAPSQSLAAALCKASDTGHEIHILYIHGIANDGPTDSDSLELRKSICDYLKDCTTESGTPVGPWDYASLNQFAPGAAIPQFEYLGQPVWRNAEEWSAAAPYAIHFKIDRTSGSTLYVDELNWWPLVFSLKCRQIIKGDASFVAPNKQRIETCSHREDAPGVPGRFKSYDWITPDDAKELLKLPARGAKANRGLKVDLMDWGFADAVIALGPVRPYILSGLRQLVLKSLADSHPEEHALSALMPDNDEFVIVSHSLGSYLIFSALDAGNADAEATPGSPQTQIAGSDKERFHQVLARTSTVYFFANQLRLLELASLDGPSDRNLISHLEVWGKLRCDHQKLQPGASEQCTQPRIIALSDPSDLLTWTVPDLQTVKVENLSVKNATRWFGLFENPTLAHSNYAKHKRAIQAILGTNPTPKNEITAKP